MKEGNTSSPENTLYFRVHAKNLLEEISENRQMSVARIPLGIMYDILRIASQRAIELGDEKMIAIMCALTMYDEVDPESDEYNEDVCRKMAEKFSEYINKNREGYIEGRRIGKDLMTLSCAVCKCKHYAKDRVEKQGADLLYRSACPICGATEVV